MALFAKLGLNGKVIKVHCVADHIASTEKDGIEYLHKLHNYPFWVQVFRDGTRKNYAAKGSTYDEDRDAFIYKQPFPSWTINEATCRWEAPVAHPKDGKYYKWNEETTSWELDLEHQT